MEIGISALYGNLSLPNPFTVMVSIYEFSLLYSFSHLSLSSQFWEFACCKNKKNMNLESLLTMVISTRVKVLNELYV